MRISRKLKKAEWKYDFKKNELRLIVWMPTGAPMDSQDEPPFISETIRLNRTYMFSLMRFIIRVAQKMRIEESKEIKESFNKRLDKKAEILKNLRDRIRAKKK